ncbi:MAG TPA: DUF4159 domain-containing protein [Pirellulaceae bacterium]|nr:DUF4159 domain-containing protein [Pirellulaceae bacterium]
MLKNRTRPLAVGLIAVLILSAVAVAQFSGGYGRGRGRGRSNWNREIRPEEEDRGGIPVWKNDDRFKEDVFYFVRIKYSSGGYGRGGRWDTDYPDSDFNFPYRLHELTALETDPYGKIVELTDDALFDYPWIYLIEPGRMYLEEAEVLALRKYLLNGGFMMVDDFWGEDEWQNFYDNIKQVFPDREPIELPLEHDIFHCVYDLKQKPQVPSIHAWWNTGGTSERWDSQTPHYKGIFDDKGRMMVIICHNTDIGDGWEREGLDNEYFKQFSEKWSYPLGINILMYAMTH